MTHMLINSLLGEAGPLLKKTHSRILARVTKMNQWMPAPL